MDISQEKHGLIISGRQHDFFAWSSKNPDFWIEKFRYATT